jgi:Rieske Fe-S protein
MPVGLSQRAIDMSDSSTDRRRWFVRMVWAVIGLVAAPVGGVVGGAALSPSLTRRRESWIPAAPLDDLDVGVLKTTHVQAVRQDGYLRTIERDVVFLTKAEDGSVIALSSVCTHLGCRVAWDARGERLRCPCHGGVFTSDGHVQAGPPPRPLSAIPTRTIDGIVHVQL